MLGAKSADAAQAGVAGGGKAPLIVDVDGTLLRGDLLWEGLVQLCVQRPLRLAGLLPALLRGRAAFKAYVAREAPLQLDTMPLDEAALELMGQARAEGRPVILASGADAGHMAALVKRTGADGAWSSDGTVSLTGEAKLVRIRSAYTEFDYVGNEVADLPLWRAARQPFGLNLGPVVRWRALRQRPDMVLLKGSTRPRVSAVVRALRPHQWSKNALLFLPALAAHLEWTEDVLVGLLTGFLAFCAVASSVYLVNDVIDLPHDRRHPRKSRRPLAAGDLSIPGALLLIAGLLGVAVVAASRLPPIFAATLALYMVVSTSYSLVLKKRALLDVLTLAGLYAIRIIAGATLVGVPLSRWFLGFSVFFFFSLALVKRVVELKHAQDEDRESAQGRGYRTADLPVLTSLGTTATGVASLVYCLYITSDDVGYLYAAPDFLWLGLPILLYWQARIWLLTGRGVMEDDPVVFALRDRLSHLLLMVFLVTVWLAA